MRPFLIAAMSYGICDLPPLAEAIRTLVLVLLSL